MIADMTTLISGIIDSIETLISPVAGETSTTTVAYVALLAMPVLAGVVAFTRRLVKRAKN